jgi:Uri superfamily endonuclease
VRRRWKYNGRATYILVLRLTKPRRLRIGRLGLRSFPAGFFLYVGSAFGPGGLKGRMGHHLRGTRRCRWHIDYLRGACNLWALWASVEAERCEHRWAALLAQSSFTAAAVQGFGSSDCACPTHLFYCADAVRLHALQRRLRRPRDRRRGCAMLPLPLGVMQRWGWR